MQLKFNRIPKQKAYLCDLFLPFMNLFEALGLGDAIIKAVEKMGFKTPSEIQQKAIPMLLSEDTDIVALAQTGTGKTAAFGFPLIEKIDISHHKTQGLILSPTRELCIQITNEIKNYAQFIPELRTVAVYGGASITDQARQIKRGAHIIVATPGRMQDMINRGMVDISDINYCILDEADEMLNMGFYEDINAILSHTPDEKSTWLFSATMPKEVSRIAQRFMSNPKEITVGSKNTGSKNVSHEYYQVSSQDRYLALKRLADANPSIFSVVFCRTKRDTQNIAERLIEDGYNAAALHGDLSQQQRDLVMKSFRGRQVQFLVATDVAARGIDVDDITHVINYQLPDEVETYTHRSGRTGRAGKQGTSMVIATRSETRKIKMIERIINQNFEKKDIPSGKEICKIQLIHSAKNVEASPISEDLQEHLPLLEELLEKYNKEELIQKFFSVEFSRFNNYYKNAKDLNAAAQNSRKSNGGSDSTRYFVNIGEKDGFNWMSLKDFLKNELQLGRDAVSRVDVKETFSFFNTDAQHTDQVLEAFKELKYKGRNVNIEISKMESRSSRRNGGGRRRNDRRRSGDDGGNFSSRRRGGDRATSSSRSSSNGEFADRFKNTRKKRRRNN